MRDKETDKAIIKNYSFKMQFGLSLIVPIVLCLVIGSFVRSQFNLGDWVMAVAIVVGILGSIGSLLQYMRYAQKQADEGEKRHKEED